MKAMVESAPFILGLSLVVLALVTFALWRLRTRQNKDTAAKHAADGAQYALGLRHPNYAAFEKRYGCAAPPVLRELYENAESDLEGDFEVQVAAFPKPLFVAYFLGIAEENMSLVWPGTEGFFVFASDGSGNRYLVDPQETDPTVYLYDHEIKKRESLKLSLSQFLAVKRNKSAWGSKSRAAR
jgi:hypothetical protein